MAEEYMSVVNRLWDSWDADAVVADLRSGRLVDPAKVRSVDFDGRWYKSRGPLNSGPAPQGRPVIAQAGGSPRGRQFAAGHADTIVAMSQGFEGMRAYRDDVRARMRALGRDPDQCKVLFLISPILGASDAEAEAEERRRNEQAAADVSSALAFFGKITNIDFGGYDLDTPVSRLDLHTNGHQQSLDEFRRFAGDRSLRQAMAAFSQGGKSLRLVGGPERIADEMATAMEAVGGDGFLISLPAITRRAMAEIADGLVPALQARGLARREYRHAQFRDNLLDF
jgi:alkanesulfonate monooxygenase SsuD/methylene tetrahydromethanopterin reductase-like flavin-dependent oxidoreductase (luciferase family)